MLEIVNYLAGFAILASVYAVLALGLNVHWGVTGLMNIGIAGFFALGAYTTALLTTPPPDPAKFEQFVFGGNLPGLFQRWGVGGDLWFLAGLAAAALVCALVALLIGLVTLRLREEYLAIVTLGIAETIRRVFLNESWLGNGSRGLYQIPKFLGNLAAPWLYDLLYAGVALALLLALFFIVERTLRSPWGRVLRAIREDEVTAAASGKNVFRFKLQAFVLGALIMGIGGGVYAHGFRFIDPFTFDPLLATFIVWVMLMVGGSGKSAGALLGALVIWGAWSGSQLLPGYLSNPNLRYLLLGVAMVLVLLLRPQGLLGRR
ncbi:MAG: branched-chain amino acid ABC transporter permease [SAR202 cluster bacterium]|nr:branched-chain amino acid ABC transporter permease [SAR202 cluster bacterium]